jgi:Zn finger protein HypA/HybF involved in hydrogenase expression
MSEKLRELNSERRMNACEAPVMLRFQCPKCGREYKVQAGKGSDCPNCNEKKE